MAKKIIALKNDQVPLKIKHSEIITLINLVIKKIPDLYNNKSTGYAMSKATHIKYVLESLRCLETEDYHFLYNDLKNKNISYEEYKQSLSTIINTYKSLSLSEKRLLVYTALLHDIYYKTFGTYEAEHGPLGVEYLKKHPELYQEFGLTKDEVDLMFDLISSHGYFLDLGRYIFPEELKITAKNKKLALLIDFLDCAGKEISAGKGADAKHVCLMDAKLNRKLPVLFDYLIYIKDKPEEFYKFRLKYLCSPLMFQELSDKEHKNILAQLDNQSDAKEIKTFLNTRLKVDDFNIFVKGYELLPTKANGLKDFTLYFEIFRRLMQVAKQFPDKYVRLDTKDIKNGLTDIIHEDIKNFFQKILMYLDNSQIFTLDIAKGKIIIRYKKDYFDLKADNLPIYNAPFSLEDTITQKMIQVDEKFDYDNRTINHHAKFILPLVDSYFVNKDFDNFKRDPMVHQQEVIPNLFIGDFSAFKAVIKDNPYHIALSLKFNRGKVDYTKPEKAQIKELGFNLPDNNSIASWETLSGLLPEVFKAIDEALTQNKRVLISCGQGISRSSTVIIAYLMYRYKVTFNQAFGFLYKRRPVVNPSPVFAAGLKAYERRLFPNIEPEHKAIYEKQFPKLYENYL